MSYDGCWDNLRVGDMIVVNISGDCWLEKSLESGATKSYAIKEENHVGERRFSLFHRFGYLDKKTFTKFVITVIKAPRRR